jgi:hypothetical protein
VFEPSLSAAHGCQLRDRAASLSLAILNAAIVSEHPSSNGHAVRMTREVLKTFTLVLREAGSESSAVAAVAESPLPARMAAPTFATALPPRLEFGRVSTTSSDPTSSFSSAR